MVATKQLASDSLPRLLIVLVLSGVMMITDQRWHYGDAMRDSIANVFSSVYHITSTLSGVAADLTEEIVEVSEDASDEISLVQKLQKKNSSLQVKQLLLQRRLQKLDSLEQENIRLRKLLDSSFRLQDEEVLIAELLAIDLDPFTHHMIVNQGSYKKTFVGQPVVDATGVVGQVTRITKDTSTILLITDPNHAIPVQLNRNGLRAVASGTGMYNQLRLNYVSMDSDIKVDDLVITSGLGGMFPVGYPVGKVTEVERNAGNTFATVNIEPSANLQNNREVLLLWANKR